MLMRLDRRWSLGVMAAGVALAGVALVVAGPLDPPNGAVAPTYKTLTEVEPRIAINATNTPGDADSLFKITQPGSYYLTGNVIAPVGKNGIGIGADDVTLDLNGFALIGTGSAPPSVGIAQFLDAPRNLVVRNGTIRNFAYGMLGDVVDSAFENLAVLDNNAGGFNLSGPNSIFRNCRVKGVAESGIGAGPNSLVLNCVVEGAAGAITLAGGGIVEGCTVISSVGTIGIQVEGGGVVRGCSVSGCIVGISATAGAQVESCVVNLCSSIGIQAAYGVTVRHCTINTCPVGIADSPFTLGRLTIDSNTIAECPIGIRLVQAGTTVTRNTIHHSTTTPVQAAAGNAVGSAVSTPVGAGAWDNIAN